MASDPTQRALALLSLLSSRAECTGAELAERLGVTERTVRRDVDRLRSLQYRVDSVGGTRGGIGCGRAPQFRRCSSAKKRRLPR